jgi:hypothetical protein
MMGELVEGLEKITLGGPLSPRAEFFRSEIDRLESKLEQIRDNTLIR